MIGTGRGTVPVSSFVDSFSGGICIKVTPNLPTMSMDSADDGYFMDMSADADNYVRLGYQAVNDRLIYEKSAGGVSDVVTRSSIGWAGMEHEIFAGWNMTDNQRLFIDRIQVNSDPNDLGVGVVASNLIIGNPAGSLDFVLGDWAVCGPPVDDGTCENCEIISVECPGYATAGETFQLNYSFDASSHLYPFEIRTLYVDNYVVGGADDCVWWEDVQPDCFNADGNFITSCPIGGADHFSGMYPVKNVNYFVGCSSATTNESFRCLSEPEFSGPEPPSCTVECRYCQSDYSLVFNVTAPPTTEVDCTLHMWYNDTLDWCKLYPVSDRDTSCVTAPYAAINVVHGEKRVFVPEVMSVFSLENVIGPAQYKWNVECKGVAGVSRAPEDWTFISQCP